MKEHFVKERLSERKIKAPHLAKLIGVSDARAWALINSEDMMISTLRKIAEVTNINIEDFLKP